MCPIIAGRNLKSCLHRIKPLLLKVTLLICSLFGILLCIELVLIVTDRPKGGEVWRVRDIYRLDSELIYSIAPLKERTWKYGEFHEHVTTNSHGLRDSELKERSSYEKRIVILGDSMTFGHGVNDDQTYPNQLEALFLDQKRQIDVINAGTKGYGTDQTYKLYLTRLRPLAPDILVLSIYPNDIHDNIGFPLYTIDDNALVPLDPTKNWLYMFGHLDISAPSIIRERRLYHFTLSKLASHDWCSVLPKLEYKELMQWSRNKIALQIAQLQALGEEDGFELMVLCIPNKNSQPSNYSWLQQDDMWLYNANQDPVWQTNKGELFFTEDYHLTVEGNHMLAKKLHGVLIEHGF